ncbi:putative serine protease 47 [Sorex fumeus]|uniref:putative serine protease 47 n=1 Tax=Sorex fumeus TaxID=62283 RepID=UPI0024ACD53B|nr:putative serine protease 47 [Sorex fumeus]
MTRLASATTTKQRGFRLYGHTGAPLLCSLLLAWAGLWSDSGCDASLEEDTRDKVPSEQSWCQAREPGGELRKGNLWDLVLCLGSIMAPEPRDAKPRNYKGLPERKRGPPCLPHGVGLVSTVCGKPRGVGMITGGQEAVEGQWPWLASLQYRGSHPCGAVLIDSHWVFSTTHCFPKKSHAPADYWMFGGSTQLYQDTQYARRVTVSCIIIHPDFKKLHHFATVLQLHQPVNFSSYIIPVCLPTPGMELPLGTSCWITGWGKLTGDSGGLRVFDFSKSWVLLGLASWGLDCQRPISLSVFTSVAHFIKWIVQIQRLVPLPVSLSAPPEVPFLYES